MNHNQVYTLGGYGYATVTVEPVVRSRRMRGFPAAVVRVHQCDEDGSRQFELKPERAAELGYLLIEEADAAMAAHTALPDEVICTDTPPTV